MKNKSLILLCCSAPLLLAACQSVENVLSDSGLRQETRQNVVVNPVPRNTLQTQRTSVATKTVDASGATSEPKTQPAAKAAVQDTSTQKGMVPNVAPSLGE